MQAKIGILILGTFAGFSLATGDRLLATLGFAFAVSLFFTKLFYGEES